MTSSIAAANQDAHCDLDARLLSAWFDGEAGVRGHVVEAHLRVCKTCPQKLQAMRRAQTSMVSTLDKSMGQIEPLYALQRIRERVAERATRSVLQRVLGALHDVWLFQRPALSATFVALLLGTALAATGHVTNLSMPIVSRAVAIESLHVETNARTHVSASPDGEATLIWVETNTEATHAPR